MRNHLTKSFVACAVLLAVLLLLPGSPPAADAAAHRGKVDPAVVKKVELELRTLAETLAENGKPDKDTVFVLLANYLLKNPEIYGAAFAFAPTGNGGKKIKSSPYLYRQGEKLIQKDLIDSYDYTAPDQKWYTAPVKLRKPVWSKPYFDKGGGEAWMTTYSIPVFSRGKGHKLIGVVTSDVLVPGKQ